MICVFSAATSGALAASEHFGGAVDDGFDLDREDSYVDPDADKHNEGAAGGGGTTITDGVDTLSPSSSPGRGGTRFNSFGGTSIEDTGGGGGGSSTRQHQHHHHREKALVYLDPAYRPVWNPSGKGKCQYLFGGLFFVIICFGLCCM